MKPQLRNVMVGSALLLHASTAFAEVSSAPNALVGSDTLDQVMFTLLDELGPNGLNDMNALPSGIKTTSDGYLGLGSSQGERQLMGTPNAGEPTCTDDNGGENMGCQEIAPMSRAMGSNVCGAGNSEAAGKAEGLAFCGDGVALYTDNMSYGQYGDDATSCTNWAAGSFAASDNSAAPTPRFVDNGVGNLRDQGTLPNTGYVVGGGTLTGANAWKDIIRIIYTGCKNTDGTCSPTVPRLQRCDDPVRHEVLNSWANIVEGSVCPAGDSCPTGLRRAYRRDDSSGTTGVFLSYIGVDAQNFPSRASIINTLTEAGAAATGCNPTDPIANRKLIRPIPENFPFCDGGMYENFYPDCHNGVVFQFGGDPIRKPCAPEDDICHYDGNSGVVQAIRSTPADNNFPKYQCNRGLFAKAPFISASLPVCPDGSVPSAGACNVPYYRSTTSGPPTSFDCVNPTGSRPSTVPGTTDGRAYNHVRRADSNVGSVVMISAGKLADVASWRMNMVKVDTSNSALLFGKTYAASDYVCTEANATSNIGCITSRTTCTMGFAGRQAVWDPSGNNYHAVNEPFQLRDSTPSDANIASAAYPFARSLWLNAIGGFENLSADCAARGATPEFCEDELRIAQEFYHTGEPGNKIAESCLGAGYIPFGAAVCTGATASAGCGAPTSQALSACEPL